MFRNAGKKLTALAMAIFIILCVGALITAIGIGVAMGNAVNGFLGFIMFIVSAAIGAVSAWLSTILLYSFGELCENVRLIREGMGVSDSAPMQLDAVLKGTPFDKPRSAPQPQQASGYGAAPYGAAPEAQAYGGVQQFPGNDQYNAAPQYAGNAQYQDSRQAVNEQYNVAPQYADDDSGDETFVSDDQYEAYDTYPRAQYQQNAPKQYGSAQQDNSVWTCPGCFKQNRGTAAFCNDCGRPKPTA